MIKVFDNLLPPTLVDRIEDTLISSDFYWFALDNISLGSQTPKNEFTFPSNFEYVETTGMSKPLWKDGKWFDPYDAYMLSRMIIDYACQAAEIDLLNLIRIKGNFLTPNPVKPSLGEAIHYPHLDFYDNHYAMVYYVNDSDGDTIIFNEKWYDGIPMPVNLTVKQRVSPKRGRLVIFDGLHFHTSQSPTNHSERIILNINVA